MWLHRVVQEMLPVVKLKLQGFQSHALMSLMCRGSQTSSEPKRAEPFAPFFLSRAASGRVLEHLWRPKDCGVSKSHRQKTQTRFTLDRSELSVVSDTVITALVCLTCQPSLGILEPH